MAGFTVLREHNVNTQQWKHRVFAYFSGCDHVTGSLVAEECHLKFMPACVALLYFKLKTVHGYGWWGPESTETALCSGQFHSGSLHSLADCFLCCYSRPLSHGEASAGGVSESLYNMAPGWGVRDCVSGSG